MKRIEIAWFLEQSKPSMRFTSKIFVLDFTETHLNANVSIVWTANMALFVSFTIQNVWKSHIWV